MMSQWSLTFEVRKRALTAPKHEAWWAQSQWSLTFEVRKRLPNVCRRSPRNCGRNGA